MSVIAPYAAVWCVMALVVTPIQLVEWGAFRRLGTVSGTAASLLWALLWDVVLPGVGLAIGGTISARVFSGAASSAPKREIA
jgi:hypothetical protein